MTLALKTKATYNVYHDVDEIDQEYDALIQPLMSCFALVHDDRWLNRNRLTENTARLQEASILISFGTRRVEIRASSTTHHHVA